MSYEAWGDGPDEESLAERASDAGYMDPDQVERITTLAKHLEMPEDFPRPGSKADAALILMLAELGLHPWTVDDGPGPHVGLSPEDPHVMWAKRFFPDLY